MRYAVIKRATNETNISAELNLDGSGLFEADIPVGFLTHMLSLTAKHGGMDLKLSAAGDTYIDCHHTVEDIGIVIGKCIAEALGEKKGIKRYGLSYVPMDETLARCVIDLSGRSYFVFNCDFTAPKLGEMDSEMVRDFFYALCVNASMTLHIDVLRGANNHHMAEAVFKAFGRALSDAVSIDPRVTGVPSTKGSL